MPRTELWDIHPALSGLPSELRRRRLIVPMQAWIDDSGTNDPPVFVLAGFIARAEQWAAFTDAWNEVLAEGRPIRYFKMKEAFHLRGEFEGWSKPERDAKLALLAIITSMCLPGQIAALVRHDDYKAIYTGAVARTMDDPYVFLMDETILATHYWMKERGLHEPVEFIFDRQLKKEAFITAKFAKLQEEMPDELRPMIRGTPLFKDDLDNPPLQAADLLAWHVRRAYVDLKAGGTITLTAALPFIFQKDRRRFHFKNEESLRKRLDRLREHTKETGRVLPHPMLAWKKNWDEFITRCNTKFIAHAKEEDSEEPIHLFSIDDKRMRRFELVHSCPTVHTPHLHRKGEGTCLGED